MVVLTAVICRADGIPDVPKNLHLLLGEESRQEHDGAQRPTA